jgi:hypothetical protein
MSACDIGCEMPVMDGDGDPYLMKPVEFDELLFKMEDAVADLRLVGE